MEHPWEALWTWETLGLETLGLADFFFSFLPAVAVTIVTGFYSIFHSDATNFLMAFSPHQSFPLAQSVKRSAIKHRSERLTIVLQDRCEMLVALHRDGFRCWCLGCRLSGDSRGSRS